MAEARSVNGWGARCGCGGMSRLHLANIDGRGGLEVTPERSIFLCQPCAEQAIKAFLAKHPTRPPYWPGDEGRDETYVVPSGARPANVWRLGDRAEVCLYHDTPFVADESLWFPVTVEAFVDRASRVKVRAVDQSDDPLVDNEWTVPFRYLRRACSSGSTR